jgi:predicted amidohydrolase YtcJ
VGRLTAGYRADLVVVPADGFREPLDAAALASTRPLATLIDGSVTYRGPGFDP